MTRCDRVMFRVMMPAVGLRIWENFSEFTQGVAGSLPFSQQCADLCVCGALSGVHVRARCEGEPTTHLAQLLLQVGGGGV